MSFNVWCLCLFISLSSCTTKACTPLDQGPFLDTLPTLQFEFDETNTTEPQPPLPVSSNPYYSEVRVSGDNISLSVESDASSIIDISEYFQFVAADGKNYMKLIKPIDRDGLTASPDDDISFLTFTLICTSPTVNNTFDARVVINDVNDNPPAFIGGNTVNQVSIPEATAVGTVIYQASATDLDANLEANLTYTLVTFTTKFVLDPLTGAVSVAQDLDYESMVPDKFYALVLTVKDGGPKVFHTATTTLQVNITDSDDQDPAYDYPGCFKDAGVCAWPKYTTGRQLRMNASLQVFPVPNTISSSVKIVAYDLDIGIGNEIKFSISSTIPKGEENNFQVDTTRNGSKYIATIRSLVDMEVSEGLQLFLKAEENSINKGHTVAMILFTGDKSSTSNFTMSSQACQPLDEGPYLGTHPILNLAVDEATTQDIQAAMSSGSMKYFSELRIAGNFALREFTLTADYDINDPFYYFEVVTQNGVNYMRLTKPVDRDGVSDNIDEQVSYIPFTLICTPANQSLSQVAYDVHIFIQDVNDNTPRFLNTDNQVSIPETTLVGAKIYTASAVDDDENMDGNLTFSLETSNVPFIIDPLTGDVLVNRSIDYESMRDQKYFNLTLRIEDAGPGTLRTATMMLQVHVMDADDNDPAFVYSGCFAHNNICAWPKYTGALQLKKNDVIKVYPVPNKVNGYVSINAVDGDADIGNEIVFSIASTIPPGQESNFKVETVKSAVGKEYTANVISLVDQNLSEGFEIFLKAEEKSENKRYNIAMILFTTTAGATSAQQQQQDSSSSNSTRVEDYSSLEIALIIVVSILAAFLFSMIVGVVIFSCLRRKSSDRESFSTSM